MAEDDQVHGRLRDELAERFGQAPLSSDARNPGSAGRRKSLSPLPNRPNVVRTSRISCHGGRGRLFSELAPCMSLLPAEIILSDMKDQELLRTIFVDVGQLVLSSYVTYSSTRYIYKNTPLLILMLVMGYAELANIMSYTVISLASTSLDVGDVNWNFVLSGLVEFPAYCVAPKLLDRFPSKFVMTTVLTCASGTLIALKFIYHDMTAVYLLCWLIAKFFATSCYMTLLIVVSELFPTKCRSFAVDVVLTFANIGSVIAPHLAVLNDILPDLAFLVFGATLAIATVLVAIFMPRTTKLEA